MVSLRRLIGAAAVSCALALAQGTSALAQTIEPPKLVTSAEVAYPEGAHGDGVVRLLLLVIEDGTVPSAATEEGAEPFASAAASAARGFRYAPATRGGKPVRARIRIEVRFTEPTPPPEDDPTLAPRAAAPKRASEPDEEVRVRGVRVEPGRTASLGRAEVREIPGVFGDPFRAVEVLPGVTPIVSGLPFFFIRGAPPGNVGYFLDGVRVPVLFHVGAGPSVVHPALIERVDLYPGGYPARFGRYAGGIVAGETGPPSTEVRGEGNLRLFDAGALVEAPFDGGRGAALAGGRYSYTAALLTQLSPDTTLKYWDYQGRVGYDVTPRDRISVFSFGSYDFLGERTATTTLTGFETEFHRVDVRYDRRFGDAGSLRTAVTFGLDRTRVQDDRFVRSRLLGTRTEFEQRVHPAVVFRAGTDLLLESFEVETGTDPFGPSVARIAAQFPTRDDLTFGVRADAVVLASRRFELVPGVRSDVFTSSGASAVGVDPRLATRTTLGERTKLLSALGLAHQAPSFVIPLPGVQPGGLRGGLQRAMQESVGIEHELLPGTVATVTLFHNAFFDMTDSLSTQARDPSGCPPGSLPTGSLAGDRGFSGPGGGGGTACGTPRFAPGTLGPDRTGGGGGGADSVGTRNAAAAFEARTLGSAYGLELFIKRKLTQRLGGFLSYTLSRSARSFGTRTFVASFDRTHVGNVAAAYDLGRGWRAGARTVFYTGLPQAPGPGIDSDRLPAFFRVDLRLEKRWQLGKKTWIAGVAEWMNATLSKEAIASRCTLNGCEAQMIGPVTIPSLGVEGGF